MDIHCPNKACRCRCSLPTEPTVTSVISGTTILSSCVDIVLDGSGSSGFAGLPNLFTYDWALQSVSIASTGAPSSLSIDTVTANATTAVTELRLYYIGNAIPWRTLSLGSSEVPEGFAYTFALTVTNWRGVSSTSSLQVEKISSTVLSVSIDGGGIRTDVMVSLDVLSVGSMTRRPCAVRCQRLRPTSGSRLRACRSPTFGVLPPRHCSCLGFRCLLVRPTASW